ncbi:hypothetical protein Tcan_05436 [Toxocara canis]|nr:hypothetical protein Tcan_05436 [Toxocara canis]
MAVNQEPEEIFQNSNDTNDRVSLPNAVTAVTDAPVVEHDALRDATAKVSDANSVGRLITRTIASKQQPSSLFSDSDDDIFLPATTSVQSGQKPHVQPAATQQNDGAAAVVRRGSDARGEQHSNGDRATEKESNVGTDALTTATANVASQPKAGSAGAVTKTTNSRPVGLIFATDDEDDDDIFATSSSVNRSTSTFQCRNRSSKANSATLPIKAAVPSESTAVPNKRGIFDDDSDSDNDIFR